MDIGSVLKSVGGAILSDVVPGGKAIVELINQFLPDSNKLPMNATGQQATDAIGALSPEQQQQILSKQIDLQIEQERSWAQIQDSLSKADAAGASTRPRIAMMMAWMIVIEVIAFMAVWSYAIVEEKTDVLNALNQSWPLVVSVVATPTVLLRAYYGLRTDEKKARYAAASGQDIKGLSLFGSLLKGLK